MAASVSSRLLEARRRSGAPYDIVRFPRRNPPNPVPQDTAKPAGDSRAIKYQLRRLSRLGHAADHFNQDGGTGGNQNPVRVIAKDRTLLADFIRPGTACLLCGIREV